MPNWEFSRVRLRLGCPRGSLAYADLLHVRLRANYTIPFLIELQDCAANGDVQIIAKARDDFCRGLESDGVSIVHSYVPRCIACRRSRSLDDPARWRNVSKMVNFSILKIVNGPLTTHRQRAFRREAKRLRLSLRAMTLRWRP